ncbi:MAG: pyridoxal phosphate-dependent aminotransferase [Betaproteobacteria bacterium]|nr:pyridoxal phosphate-dependent aminotransferase [Betaproteobacteria bacterium]MDH5349552.1 pyridoxal phosphate-dependent aminotransferase [Betaproteobacteria bacterium]
MTPSRLLAAHRAADIEPFHVMDVLARAQALEAAGRRVVHMEIGEPDFTAPESVVEAGVRALRDGRTAYTATLGLGALREAIAGHYRQCFGKRVSPERVAVSAGASGGLLLTVALYVNPGDELLVPDPGYPGYRHLVRAFEGVPRPLPLSPASSFQPTLEAVRAAWTPRTKGLMLGSPSNPTSTIADPAELERIARFVAERGGVLIADEIYQGLVYGAAPASALDLPGEVVLVNSFSKYFCMTGWRLGWVVLPQERVRDFEKLAQHFFICAPSAAQHAALQAFTPATLALLEARRAQFERRRDFLVPALQRAGLAVPCAPRGAFYAYADCSAFGGDAHRFALELLEAEGVAATPGLDFGSNDTARYVRFAFTRPQPELEEAAARIARFCAAR